MSEERTLVIGATGIVGRAVVRRLDRAGREVVAGRRWDGDAAPLHERGIETVVLDVENRESMVPVVAGCNHVIYCAAPPRELNRGPYMRRAVTGIRNVLEVVRQEEIDRLVVTSTAATLGAAAEGERREPVDEGDVYLPGTSGDRFVEAAWAVEQECRREAADGRFVIMLNPSVTLGPGVKIPQRDALSVGREAPVNWVELERVADAHLAALVSGRPGERYIVEGENGTVGGLYDVASGREDVQIGGSYEANRERFLLENGRHLDGTKATHIFGL